MFGVYAWVYAVVLPTSDTVAYDEKEVRDVKVVFACGFKGDYRGVVKCVVMVMMRWWW